MRYLSVAMFTIILLLSGCTDRKQPVSSEADPGGPEPRFDLTWYPNPNAGPNPLVVYIRENWTGGDMEATGGTHYDHIKTYGHNYSELSPTEALWAVNHFDMYMGKSEIADARDGSGYPDMLFGRELANTDHLRTWGIWVFEHYFFDDPVLNPLCYTLDDMLIHYAYDTEKAGWGITPGWNPADDTNGDGTRDIDPPSDPDRTAWTLEEARAWGEPYPGIQEYLGTLAGHERHAGAAAFHAYWNSPGQRAPDFVHFDVVSHDLGYALSCQIDRTLDYYEQDPATLVDQYYLDQPYFVAATTSEYENLPGGQETISLGNMVRGYYTCDPANNPVQKLAGLAYLENVFCECWIETGSGIVNNLANTGKRERILSCPIAEWMEAGKGYVCSGFDPGNSGRGKRFTITMFYMLNHQNAFYYYRTHDHMLLYPEETIEGFQWNPWIEVDVGQPVVNTLGKPDFQGFAGTNRYFVYETGADYEVLGRCYQRSDGTNILILVKLMDKNNEGGEPFYNVEGDDPSTISLPGYYKKVLGPLGALSQSIDSIILNNNDGVILIESAPPGGGCTGGKINPGEG